MFLAVLENTMIYAPLSSFMSNGCLDLLARFGFSDHLKKGEEFSQFLRFPEDSSLMSSAGTIEDDDNAVRIHFQIHCSASLVHVPFFKRFRCFMVFQKGVRPLTEDEHLYLRLCKLGVPEGVTLLEFEEPSEEQQQPTPEVQEVQPSGEVPDEVAVECPDHRSCNFVKDDQFYFGCCKYCLLPAGDED